MQGALRSPVFSKILSNQTKVVNDNMKSISRTLCKLKVEHPNVASTTCYFYDYFDVFKRVCLYFEELADNKVDRILTVPQKNLQTAKIFNIQGLIFLNT